MILRTKRRIPGRQLRDLGVRLKAAPRNIDHPPPPQGSRMIRASILCVSLAVAAANLACAQSAPPPPSEVQAPASREWRSLSPQQQRLLQNYQNTWNSLPPDRQQALGRNGVKRLRHAVKS